MAVIKNPENWNLNDCIEDCHYASRFCYIKDDGTMVCPSERSCADECRKRFG